MSVSSRRERVENMRRATDDRRTTSERSSRERAQCRIRNADVLRSISNDVQIVAIAACPARVRRQLLDLGRAFAAERVSNEQRHLGFDAASIRRQRRRRKPVLHVAAACDERAQRGRRVGGIHGRRRGELHPENETKHCVGCGRTTYEPAAVKVSTESLAAVHWSSALSRSLPQTLEFDSQIFGAQDTIGPRVQRGILQLVVSVSMRASSD